MELTADEVCAIIDQCGESRITELKFGDLHLVFGPAASTPVLEHAEVVKESSPASVAEITAIQTHEAERSLVQSELSLRQDQLDQMLIEDPLQAEKLLIEGELEADDEFDAENS